MTIYLKRFSRFLYRMWSRLLDIVGDIKVFRFPFFVVYDPHFFDMDGRRIAEALEVLRPGDVVLRGFDCYLDGHLIRGDYSHGSVFVGGDIVHAVSPRVERIHPIEFMECDRIAILRPRDQSLAESAVKTALALEAGGTPYDFDFNTDDPTEVYCFELVARCYPSVQFRKFDQRFILGLVRKTTYLAESFLSNGEFELVFEHNPRKKRSFRKVQ